MLASSARLLRLLSLLQARARWTGAELTERLEVTDRTLRRDMDRLRTLGYPVHATSGPAGGYQLGAGRSLPPLMLSDDEALAVALGLGSAAATRVAGIADASARALAKLDVVLPTRLRRRLLALRAAIVRPPDGGPEVGLTAVATLASACSEHRAASFDYAAHAGDVSRREVEPNRLALLGGRWYLVAWDRGRRDWRTFRVDRIAALALAESCLPREPPAEDIATYVSRGVSSGAYGLRARVVFAAPAEAVRATVPPAYGVVTPLGPDRCRLEAGASHLDGFAVWLAIVGLPFTVEEPVELRARLRELAARLAAAGREDGAT
jgi:predicted DNA-binding transcriptional regulator YafY